MVSPAPENPQDYPGPDSEITPADARWTKGSPEIKQGDSGETVGHPFQVGNPGQPGGPSLDYPEATGEVIEPQPVPETSPQHELSTEVKEEQGGV